ncbi:bifunctional phosphoribosylaminoimidazolecarboxamide formyltransferase/IMP cyclohydrolase [Varunaivibrio sulfuroxidans]|uniref:Bifunctional purine biosynthesis protein PurH n=1 Tax=Varunaivibrio sulfuroxidans TaxID=1773489 RepID=A0A4R3JHU0_9PROT|nr:bifunctional phosphoribosylaminoimidazolecarboxamide formyltransferase/IMP cyclohydrolase [Varunaivibrio sulfuroxidans]TCS64826.1 phosphoribosylaminoimidazolecarboxamide formyltransferase/IMP cyclohydrolase [Varunaivibrio sulfuroxidans]WES29873.1 bifunctional phosphoribosylaminoimidazolecarboxamide formyltransferase/IMP cyclohydrolase [Varunaivibrio sulfuroxidans]
MSAPIRRALISVSDKTGLAEFGQFLAKNGVEILSTGGSAKALRDAGVDVVEVSEHTGFPEIMDGRVKTLQPTIHGGLLAVRDNPQHIQAMKDHNIAAIDLLVVNLYPFEATVAKGADFDTCIENIDIGGPALIRAGAKNHAFVTVVVDPSDYVRVMDEMTGGAGTTSAAFRRTLAHRAYARTAAYDSAISRWFAEQEGETFPQTFTLSGALKQTMRYGENPHQDAAFYVNGEDRPGVANAVQLQGKELSYNNLNDTDAAFELVSEFDDLACAIIKHANPCGVSLGGSLKEAYLKALSCDSESAFGGIVALNRTLDGATAEEIVKIFTEVVIAPDIDDDAKAILATKKNIRVLSAGAMAPAHEGGLMIKSLAGGFLLQGRDNKVLDDMKVVTKRQPSAREMADLRFAFTIAKHVKSNAIVYAKNAMTVGVGAGQMSRVNASRIAAFKAEAAAAQAGDSESWAKGSVVSSDAFFPFADGLLAAAEAGATAVIQPGGSIRDEDVIKAADDAGLAMVFTGMRHFRH